VPSAYVTSDIVLTRARVR